MGKGAGRSPILTAPFNIAETDKLIELFQNLQRSPTASNILAIQSACNLPPGSSALSTVVHAVCGPETELHTLNTFQRFVDHAIAAQGTGAHSLCHTKHGDQLPCTSPCVVEAATSFDEFWQAWLRCEQHDSHLTWLKSHFGALVTQPFEERRNTLLVLVKTHWKLLIANHKSSVAMPMVPAEVMQANPGAPEFCYSLLSLSPATFDLLLISSTSMLAADSCFVTINCVQYADWLP